MKELGETSDKGENQIDSDKLTESTRQPTCLESPAPATEFESESITTPDNHSLTNDSVMSDVDMDMDMDIGDDLTLRDMDLDLCACASYASSRTTSPVKALSPPTTPISSPDANTNTSEINASIAPSKMNAPPNSMDIRAAQASTQTPCPMSDTEDINSCDTVASDNKPHRMQKNYLAKLSLVPNGNTAVSSSGPRPEGRAHQYVGLLNQEMTCYLNSLLQALYMTPEFRNAMYRWQCESGSLPFHLQKLFVSLQTSSKSAIGTAELTETFSWMSPDDDSQQHDVQELCRIMFESLRQKLPYRDHMNFISGLYEGKMIDCIACLECRRVKVRHDTFLDIPLSVRPFGSTVPFGSIEEAFNGFIQPEILRGSNSYFCDKCNKKCDASKCLKFKTFPYILTLHIKRFDFNYRNKKLVKLNDKVTFPLKLDLNGFIDDSDNAMGAVGDPDGGLNTKGNESHGPYIYDLFAIMVHSGNAIQGHYYAYIMDFETGKWNCFNDDCVTPIRAEDIEHAFGESNANGQRLTSSTTSVNAYMLMYRQIDADRNQVPIKQSDFPEHIRRLSEQILKAEEEEMKTSRYSNTTNKTKRRQLKQKRLFLGYDTTEYTQTNSYNLRQRPAVNYHSKFQIRDALANSFKTLPTNESTTLSNCRRPNEFSYDSCDEAAIPLLYPSERDGTLDFLSGYNQCNGNVLDKCVKAGGTITWCIYIIKSFKLDIDGPYLIKAKPTDNPHELRRSIARYFNVNEHLITISANLENHKVFVINSRNSWQTQVELNDLVERYLKNVMYLFLYIPQVDGVDLESIGLNVNYEPLDKPPIMFTAEVPSEHHGTEDDEDAGGYGMLSLPHNHDFDEYIKQNIQQAKADKQKASLGNGHPVISDGAKSAGFALGRDEGSGKKSTPSTTSSTTSGKKLTLNTEYLLQYNKLKNRYILQNFYQPSYTYFRKPKSSYNGNGGVGDGGGGGDGVADSKMTQLRKYFHAARLETPLKADIGRNGIARHTDAEGNPIEYSSRQFPFVVYKVFVDCYMELSTLKIHIGRIANLRGNYFTIHRKNVRQQDLSIRLNHYIEGETLIVQVGRELLRNEILTKIYFMRLDDIDDYTKHLPYVCDWTYTDTVTALMAKKQLIWKLQRIDPDKYASLHIGNCRLWLKSGYNPTKILGNSELLYKHKGCGSVPEFIIQECAAGITADVPPQSVTIFIRQWHPHRLRFDHFAEITLTEDTDICSKLSQISNIAPNEIAYAKVIGNFPNTNLSLLKINDSFIWKTSATATGDQYNPSDISSGSLFYYKNVSNEVTDLPKIEYEELVKKERNRLESMGYVDRPAADPLKANEK